MLRKVVSNNNDAMDILYEAAVHEDEQAISRAAPHIPQSLQVNDADSLRIWNACRFVKMGWFSAYEAMYLVDLSVIY